METTRNASEPRDVASLLLERCGLGKVSKLTRYTDEEYHKTYNSFHIVSASGEHFVLKLAKWLPEVRVYSDVLSASDPVPRLLASEPAEAQRYWLLLEHAGGSDIRDDDLRCHELAARSVADIHANHWGVSPSVFPWLGTYSQEFANEKVLLQRYQPKPEDTHFDDVARIQAAVAEYLKKLPLTIVHDDLLSMNILRDGDTVKVIDWGATVIGPYACDLGRWLGDLRHTKDRLWVPHSWVDPILKAYYQRQCVRLGPAWRDWTEFLADFRYGRCFDHLVIVLSHMKHDWPREAWFEANLSALLEDGAGLGGGR